MATTFDRGGYRILPEREALMECGSWQEAQALYQEADEILDRLGDLRFRIREAYQQQRRLQVREARARDALRDRERNAWSQQEVDRAEEAVNEAIDDLNETSDEIEALEEEFADLATQFRRKFTAVSTERGVPSLDLPDKREVQDGVAKFDA